MEDIKNDDGTYKSDTFQKIHNTFFNHVASVGQHFAASDCLLHYMCSGKKKPQNMTLHSFYTCFQKVLHAVKLLDHCYEKDLDYDETKILFFYSFPKEHIHDYVHHGKCDFNTDTLKDLKNFSRATMMLTHQ